MPYYKFIDMRTRETVLRGLHLQSDTAAAEWAKENFQDIRRVVCIPEQVPAPRLATSVKRKRSKKK